jgi:asparagine synthetase B (glutamine-hydrolysing)
MPQELYLFGPSNETDPIARRLSARGYQVERSEQPLYSDARMTLFYNGRTYAGRENIDRVVVRLDGPVGEGAPAVPRRR